MVKKLSVEAGKVIFDNNIDISNPDKYENEEYIAYFVEDKLAGICRVVPKQVRKESLHFFEENIENFNLDNTIFIAGLAIKPEFKGKGITEQILKFIIMHSKIKKVKYILSDVRQTANVNYDLYDFKVCGWFKNPVNRLVKNDVIYRRL